MFSPARSQQYRAVKSGVETLPSGCCLPRHRHRGGYATVVLDGRFIEASFAGRHEVAPGDVLLHGHFDCHSNTAPRAIAPRILRLPWNCNSIEGLFQVRDIDLLVRLAERDPWEAACALTESLLPRIERVADWPEQLARDITNDPSLSLTDWAEHHGLVGETVSRGFRRAFGASPRLFRLEVRTRAAWRAIVGSEQSLTTIAHTSRFADLAHMSRSVTAFTGASPAHWRRSHIGNAAISSVTQGSI